MSVGVSVSYYGGISLEMAELERELAWRKVPILQIRSSPYPEMGRAEQVRQARASGLDVLVFVDSHMRLSSGDVDELASVGARHGIAVWSDTSNPRALEAAAVRRDVIEAMAREEERRYENSALVESIWQGEKVAAVPLASPWHRDGSSLVPGRYLTDSQAFLHRAERAGAVVAELGHPGAFRPPRVRRINARQPVTDEPGSQFALCVPSFGALDLDQHAELFRLEKAGMTIFGVHDCPWIDHARSALTEMALSVGKGVFFLDHDIVFRAEDVIRLCAEALDRNAVVAGVYCMRRSGKSLIGSFDVAPGPVHFFEHPKAGIYPAFYSGLGFAAIPRGVFDDLGEKPKLYSGAMREGIRPWYALDCSTGFYAGEDVSFCNRVHDLTVRLADAGSDGFEPQWALSHSGRPARVFLDSRVRIFHRGSYDYGVEDVGIVVPRIAKLESRACATRREAAELLVNALELPARVNVAARDFAAE